MPTWRIGFAAKKLPTTAFLPGVRSFAAHEVSPLAHIKAGVVPQTTIASIESFFLRPSPPFHPPWPLTPRESAWAKTVRTTQARSSAQTARSLERRATSAPRTASSATGYVAWLFIPKQDGRANPSIGRP
ncbi:hypothetical protein BS50DRAFT_571230 [Corynespora cassiicola Philippines]|uniref:Uncharacterized protein n=1 Tax=Corynespora cassiicola Philippines TaxID=1448308 RepID=A0A2T2NX10_CORCC|nr:hypothetical protein BS50DRAFT_571230 [Corynespora cassiicola Philippines]